MSAATKKGGNAVSINLAAIDIQVLTLTLIEG